MKILVDLDNTLCVHRNRDYPNAVPIRNVIEKVNLLHDNGVEICLFTSRGMNSCKGDLSLIKERNESVIIDWLKRNGVKYDSIIFGKPLADYYVDDGGMSVEQFLDSEFNKLEGNSASSVIKFGKTIVKEAKNANYQFYWYEEFERNEFSFCKVPGNRLLTLNTIKMDFIDGKLLCEDFSFDSLFAVLNQVYQFRRIETEKKDFDSYLKHCKDCYSSKAYDSVLSMLEFYKNGLVYEASFCHGDLSFSNIISKEKSVYLIDPNDKEYSSYLLDLAKLRCSFDGLESILGYECCGYDESCTFLFDYFVLQRFGIPKDIIIALEITRFARILPYMDKLGKFESRKKIEEKIEELCLMIKKNA